MLQSVGSAEGLSQGLHRSPENAAPHTRAMYEYQDKCVALRCIPNLLPQSPVLAVAVEWSTDYVLLGSDDRRELVSIKHRDPGRHDWTFGRLKDKHVFRDLHAVWSAMGETGQYLFESNAGFEAALQPFIQSSGNSRAPDIKATEKLADCLGIDQHQSERFMRCFSLRAEPLPSRNYIDAVAVRVLSEVMKQLDLNQTRAEECFVALTERIAAASTQRPPDPARRVAQLIGFMQDLAGLHQVSDISILTMEDLREIVRRASQGAPVASGLPMPVEEAPLDETAESGDAPDNESMPDHSFGRGWPRNPESAYRETLRVIRNRTGTLIGRLNELAELQAFADGDEEQYRNGYLWVCGIPWAGKTALLAELIHSLSTDKDQGVVAYFLIARESQASVEQFLSATVGQLAWLLGIKPPSVTDVHVFRDFWARAADLAAKSKGRLLLVVDGIDEDIRPGGHSIAAILPTEHLGAYARVLISSRPHPEIPADVDPVHPLRAARVITLANSPYASRIRILAEQEIRAILSTATGPNVKGDRDLAFDTLGLLSAAAGALSIEDISILLSASRREVREFLDSRIARSVVPVRGPGQDRYSFAHQTLMEYCVSHPDIGGDKKYIEMVHDWAKSWERKGWPNTFEASTSTPMYLFDSYPAALMRSYQIRRSRADLDRLKGLASDERWVDAASKRIGVTKVLEALRGISSLNPDRKSVLSMIQVVEHHAQHRFDRSEISPAFTMTCVAWDALGDRTLGHDSDTVQRICQHDPPYLIPSSMVGTSASRSAKEDPAAKGAIRSLVASKAGWLVSAGSIDGTVRLWDPTLLDVPIREIGCHDGPVLSTAITKDDMVVSGGLDGCIRIWNPSNSSSWELGRCGGRVRALAVTADNLIASGGSDGQLWLWDLANPEEPGTLLGRHRNEVRAVAVTADGIIVSGGLDGTIQLWDITRFGGWSLELGQHGAVMDLAVVSGRYVASVGLNGSIRLWDSRQPTRGYSEMVPDNAALSVTSTVDGYVIYGCGDGSLGLWNPAVNGSRGLMLGAHRGAVGAITTEFDNNLFAANHHLITSFTLVTA